MAPALSESLGKRDAAGRACGLTPVEARGVTDQHSQLRLYLDGPDDKQFTFLISPTCGISVSACRRVSAISPRSRSSSGLATGELFPRRVQR